MPDNLHTMLHDAFAEKRARLYDGLKLFRPMISQVPILTTKASEVLVRGGNRSGKSILAATITASIARRRRILGPNGKPLPAFCPDDRPLLMWVIGKGEKHIGQTIHRLLCKPNQIPIFKDPKTGLVRAAHNYDEKELGRKQGLKSSPLIPEDEIAKISWEGHAANYFNSIEMKNGTVICAYTSTGEVKMGDPVDFLWIDEDIQYPDYYGEWLARTSDNKGRVLWSAWPHQSNWALMNLSQRAAEQADRERPDVAEFRLEYSKNPFIDEDQKRQKLEAWTFNGSAEWRSRDRGEFTTDLILMYPNYTKLVHGIGDGGVNDELSRQLIRTGFVPPQSWTKRLFIDPGHTCTAILFVATPPPELGDYVIAYDELYLRAHDADQTARAVLQKTSGQVVQEYVIDGRIARESIVGMGGVTYYKLFADAFQRANLRSVVNEYGFTLSSDDVSAGLLAVRTWLTIRTDGTAKFRSCVPTTPNFQQEIQMYRKTVTKEETQEKPAGGQRDHLMDDLRYAAIHGCEYVPPADLSLVAPPSAVYTAFQEQWQKTASAPHDNSIHCGAGSLTPAA